MLTFVIPVRHQATASTWDAIKRRMDVTLRSLRAQDDLRWNAIIIANEGADLPADLSGCWVVRVGFPPNKLDQNGPQQALWEGIRRDKGRRLLAGLVRGRDAGLLTGHVMVVDYDDVVSRRLAGFVAKHPEANGWFIDAGYMFSGQRLAFACPREFFELCGTSHIIRADLLNLPAREEDADETYISRTLGSHKFVKRDLEARGTPLARLPFAGAIYRMGHSDTATGSSSMIRYNLRKESIARPISLVKELSKLRYVGQGMANEFFGGTPA